MRQVRIVLAGQMQGEITEDHYARLIAKLSSLAEEYRLQVIEEE